ncbi:unnamed protein product [Urochloa humidicola]
MIAAMANYLNYDIYDIELTTVPSNNDLRKLFIETKGKSIVVIEDIDCSLDLTSQRSSAGTSLSPPVQLNATTTNAAAAAGAKRKRTSMMTLSGLLNFTDGIWSSHGGERIIVFTTNFVDKLDPALIRCGRMDMHIEMSYCSFQAFMTWAKNYLNVDTHPLFGTIEKLLQMVEITPANVAECLMMSNRTERRADLCLGRLIDELKKRVQEKEMDMKRAEAEQAASAAACGDAKPIEEDITKGRRMIDPNIIRTRKNTRKVKGEVEAKPNGIEAMTANNGGTVSVVRANDGTIDLDDSSSSDHGDNTKVVDAEAEADAKTNGTDANSGYLSDLGDQDYDNYSDDDMDDYDDDDEDEYDDDEED